MEGFTEEEIKKTRNYWNVNKNNVQEPLVKEPFFDEFAEFKHHLEQCSKAFKKVEKNRIEIDQFEQFEKKIAYFQKKLKKEETRRIESYKKRTGNNYRIPKIMREKAVQLYSLVYPSFIDEKLVIFF